MSRHLDSNSGLLLSHISHAVNSDVSKNLDGFYRTQVVAYIRSPTWTIERNALHLFDTLCPKDWLQHAKILQGTANFLQWSTIAHTSTCFKMQRP